MNKIALLRNSRHTGIPDLPAFARLAVSAGANGITIHPRPDERHIRASDVADLANAIGRWRPAFELNIEGRPEPRLLELIDAVRPEQCTLVPDAPSAFTSEKGWDLTNDEITALRPVIEHLHARGSRVILFVGPTPEAVRRVPETGADGIEIYTGAYAAEHRQGAGESASRSQSGDAGESASRSQSGDVGATALMACVKTAAAARRAGLLINAGHDLNLSNLPRLIAAIDDLAEVSIGHELTADALLIGFAAAIKAYAAALGPRQPSRGD